MQLQNNIIKQYQELYGNPTLRSISEQTGINLSRIFRLVNGSKMRLEEFQTFQKAVNMRIGEMSSLNDLANQCMAKLSANTLAEIQSFLARKLQLWEIKQMAGGRPAAIA